MKKIKNKNNKSFLRMLSEIIMEIVDTYDKIEVAWTNQNN